MGRRRPAGFDSRRGELTAPLIYRRPPTDPGGNGDGVTAAASGQPTQGGIQSASNSGSATNGSTTGVAKSDIGVVDLPNPAPPAAPVGTNSVSFAVGDQLYLTGSGNGMVFISAGTSFYRSYVLADSNGTGDNGAYVTENFSVNYASPINGSIGTLDVQLNTPGLNVHADEGDITIGVGNTTLVSYTGVSNSGGTHTITYGTETIKYSASISDTGVAINVTETKPVGPLPGAGTNSNGTAKGIPWVVSYEDGISIGGELTDQSKLTNSYSLSISSTPPS